MQPNLLSFVLGAQANFFGTKPLSIVYFQLLFLDFE
jgi:hypothetical protein